MSATPVNLWRNMRCARYLWAKYCELYKLLRAGLGGVGQTRCWHEHKGFRKHCINLILKPIDKLYHRFAVKIFNFNFS